MHQFVFITSMICHQALEQLLEAPYKQNNFNLQQLQSSIKQIQDNTLEHKMNDNLVLFVLILLLIMLINYYQYYFFFDQINLIYIMLQKQLVRGVSDGEIKLEQDKKQVTIVLGREQEKQWPISIKENIERDINGELKLSDIVLKLKRQNFIDYFDSTLSYYHEAKKVYIFCFFIPKTITQKEIINNPKYQKTVPLLALQMKKSELHCKLKFRKICKNKIDALKQEQEARYSKEDDDRRGTKQKEKSIAEVIEKVALWRKLYTGFLDQRQEFKHYELQQAAHQIGVIKKTLDDYLLQIRNGKKYGFNFHMMKNDKIGQLRSFVKDKKKKQ